MLLTGRIALDRGYSVLAENSENTMDKQGNSIIATGPIIYQGEGSLPVRVIVRHMVNGEVVVHDQYFDQEKDATYLENGRYFDTADSALKVKLAMDEFVHRVKRLVSY